jgi:hypothetical protein
MWSVHTRLIHEASAQDLDEHAQLAAHVDGVSIASDFLDCPVGDDLQIRNPGGH